LFVYLLELNPTNYNPAPVQREVNPLGHSGVKETQVINRQSVLITRYVARVVRAPHRTWGEPTWLVLHTDCLLIVCVGVQHDCLCVEHEPHVLAARTKEEMGGGVRGGGRAKKVLRKGRREKLRSVQEGRERLRSGGGGRCPEFEPHSSLFQFPNPFLGSICTNKLPLRHAHQIVLMDM